MSTSFAGGTVVPPQHHADATGERDREILRATVDWLWRCDRDFVLTEAVAPGAAGDRGVPQAPVGRSLLDLLSESENAGRGPALLQKQRPFRDLPAELQGTPLLLSGVPVFDAHGRFAGYRGSARAEGTPIDSAARALLGEYEQILMRSNEIEWRLGEANRAAQSTRHRLACLLHELRTPLNALTGYAELAQHHLAGRDGTSASESLANDLERLREAGLHMSHMLDDFQRRAVEAEVGGRPALSTGAAPTRLDQAMSEAKAMIDLSAEKAGVRVHEPPPEAAGAPAVRADQHTVMQILVNLLGNAVKFTPAGGEVGMRLAKAERGRVRVAVWDTGPGIADDEQERIFERSYRAPLGRGVGANENVVDGQGLGLSIARELARAAGGDLAVESRPAAGSTFLLDLPAADSQATVSA